MELFEYIDILKQPYDIFYTDNENSPLHWHYYSELIYMISGSVKIKCNDRDRILVSGNLCYLYPLQLHEISKNAKTKVKELYNWTKIAQDTHFSYQKAICETMAERQAKQIAQEKASKVKKIKGEEKDGL